MSDGWKDEGTKLSIILAVDFAKQETGVVYGHKAM